MDEEKGWFHSKWRPVTAWVYLMICVFDFMGAPILLAFFHDLSKMVDWHPITLQGGGLFHVSMLAIVGVTAWGRTQEKITVLQKIDKE